MNEQTLARAEKVKKLLALAEKAGTQEEAELAMARAQEMMTKHMIDDAMLASLGDGRDEDKLIDEFQLIPKSAYFEYVVQLWAAAAESNGVQVLVVKIQRWALEQGVILVGWQTDIERTKLMFDLIHHQCKRGRNRDMPAHLKALGGGKIVGDWKRAFTLAFAVRVGQRLREQAERTKQEVATTNPEFLPVLVSRQERAQRLAEDMSSGKHEVKLKYNREGYEAGHRAANQADLGNTRLGDESRLELS